VVQLVLSAEKLHVPKTRVGMYAAIGWEHARIALRSFDVPDRDLDSVPPRRLRAALLYGTLSIETQLYAPLRSALFQARALRIGIDYGTPTHVARALCLAATIASVNGTQRAARRSEELLQRAEQLFKRGGNPAVQLELLCARAFSAQFVGNIERALEPANAVEQLTESRSVIGEHGDYYYMFTVRMVQISSLQSLGRLLDARRVLQEHVASARATDNVAAILQVSMNRAIDEQALDMCAGSRARLDEEYSKLPKGDFGVLTLAHLLAVMRAACATRDFDWAFARLAEFWQPYKRSIVHRSAFVACLAHSTHARLLINHYIETGASGDLEALVRDDLAALARLPTALLADIAIARTQARLAALKGDREGAIGHMRSCLEHMTRVSFKQELEHDRYMLGLLIGGEQGAELVAQARTGLLECGVSDPDANMRAYAPELVR
jgi:hypothetical protein